MAEGRVAALQERDGAGVALPDRAEAELDLRDAAHVVDLRAVDLLDETGAGLAVVAEAVAERPRQGADD